jgi:hypothetical protein
MLQTATNLGRDQPHIGEPVIPLRLSIAILMTDVAGLIQMTELASGLSDGTERKTQLEDGGRAILKTRG